MFTGLVSDVGDILEVGGTASLRRLKIACSYPHASLAMGASVACSGVCMTVVDKGQTAGRDWFCVDAAAETLRLTTIGNWRQGTRINLERALKIGDELGGHIVSGHVDGLAELRARRDFEGMAEFTLTVPRDLARFIAPKGSVCLEGTSLTVNTVAGEDFTVLLIPHTLAVTTWGQRKAGDQLNLEVDTMARYAARLREFAPS